MNTLSFLPSLLFIPLFFALFVALILWFLELKKRKEIYFPASRILEKEKQKPKVTYRPPPFLLLLSFLLAMSSLLLYFLKPTLQITQPQKKGPQHLHIFLDLSPSMSAHLKIEDYRERVKKFIESQKKDYKLSFSSSLENKVYEEKAEKEFLERLRFHKRKTLLGASLVQQEKSIEKADLLLVFSDNEVSSWEDFHWKSYSKEKKVFHENVSVPLETKNNLFFSSVHYEGFKGGLHSWEIKISQSNSMLKRGGSVSLLYKNKKFEEKKWSFKKSQKNHTLTYSVDKKLLEGLKPGDLLSWELSPAEEDLVTLDNVFTSVFTRETKEAILIADPGGESLLRDSGNSLDIMLGLFDYEVTRFDKLPPKSFLKHTPPLLISFLKEEPLDSLSYCPKDWFRKAEDKENSLWLAPAHFSRNPSYLCNCLSSLLPSKNLNCSPHMEWQEFHKILMEHEFKAFGGQLSSHTSALAWQKKQGKTELTVFTLPLFPSKKSGLTHDKFPILLSLLLERNQKSTLTSLEHLPYENVTKEESQLIPVETSLLPPPWLKNSRIKVPSSGRSLQKNAFLPLSLLLFLMALALALEIFFHFNRKKESFVLGLFLLMAPFQELEAKIDLVYYKPMPSLFDVSDLSEQFEDRTSIELNPELKAYSKIDENTFLEPWLWMKGSSLKDFFDKSTYLENLVRWIRSGGLLILEGDIEKKLLEEIEGKLQEEREAQLQSIPLDHEIMRSFFLLKTLPSCGEKNWSILEFENRLGVLHAPFSILQGLSSNEPSNAPCFIEKSKLLQTFVNITLASLTLDYKKDQIHLDEILKRLN